MISYHLMVKTYHRWGKLMALGGEGGVSVNNLVDYHFGARLRKLADMLECIP
jgi:choline kinase